MHIYFNFLRHFFKEEFQYLVKSQLQIPDMHTKSKLLLHWTEKKHGEYIGNELTFKNKIKFG